MADKSIGELVEATTIGNTDLFVLEQAGQAKKMTGKTLAKHLDSFNSSEYIKSVANQAKADIDKARTDSATIIQQTVNSAKASIPSDYTALSQEVEFKSPPIVSRAKGDSIHLDDAADSRLYADDGGAVVELYCKAKQDGTPSIDNPVEIVGVENPVVVLQRKNLANAKNTDNQNTPVCTDQILAAGVTYTVSFNSSTGNRYLNLASLTDDGKLSSNYYIKNIGVKAGRNVVTFTPSESRKGLFFNGYGGDSSARYMDIQLEVGDTATAYEPYLAPQTVTVPLIGYGIPVASGGNYTDDKGQQWICDVIRLHKDGTGAVEQMLFSYELSYQYEINVLSASKEIRVDNRIDSNYTYVCTHAIIISSSTWGNDRIGITKFAGSARTEIAIRVPKSMTKAEFNALHVKILGVAQSPTITPLTADQVAALKTLRTFKGITDITCDQDVGMAVSYVNDPKLYIDKQIAALASRMGAAENVLTNNI